MVAATKIVCIFRSVRSLPVTAGEHGLLANGHGLCQTSARAALFREPCFYVVRLHGQEAGEFGEKEQTTDRSQKQPRAWHESQPHHPVERAKNRENKLHIGNAQSCSQ